MVPYLQPLFACLLSMIAFHATLAQSTDTIKDGDTTWTYRDDTLFTDKGFNIYVGQQLVAGKGSDEEGRYRSISFKSALAFPLMFLRETEIKNNYSYEADPNLRDRDKVKEYLDSGHVLTVKKIKSEGRKKKWHYYQVYLWDGKSSLSLKYRCNILVALRQKEITLE